MKVHVHVYSHLSPSSSSLPSSSDRLSAQDILTVRKVQEYVYSKMEPKKGIEGEQGPECFEILCHEQVSRSSDV